VDDVEKNVDGEEEGSLDFKGTVPEGVLKTRLDAWLAAQLPLVSRARVQNNIRQGLILVNGKPITKGSHVVRQGDVVEAELTGWAPLDANPEDIALDVVYEDKHVIVINKPAHMVCASV
jgi:23S rRNA-/tRNA-specific pseudouridylate synthase